MTGPSPPGPHPGGRIERVRLPRVLDRRWGYHLARRRARLVRTLYAGPLVSRLGRRVGSPADLDLHLVAFSGERDALEQMASLRSFLRYVGRPARVTLGSDGTHTPQTLARLRKLFQRLEVVPPAAYVRPELPKSLRAYAAEHPLGKKLAFMSSVTPSLPILYADADVLFFPGASVIRVVLGEGSDAPRYLKDCMDSLDGRIVPSDLAGAPPVNSGFWIIRRPLDWREPLALLEGLAGSFEFHTEQTVFHVAMHRAGGVALDPNRYVMQVDDRFDYRTLRERDPIALRHYVSNIRHQFWLNVAS